MYNQFAKIVMQKKLTLSKKRISNICVCFHFHIPKQPYFEVRNVAKIEVDRYITLNQGRFNNNWLSHEKFEQSSLIVKITSKELN